MGTALELLGALSVVAGVLILLGVGPALIAAGVFAIVFGVLLEFVAVEETEEVTADAG